MLKKVYQKIDRDGFAILFTTAFGLIAFFLIQSHEMWRDELQAWLLARDSISITELFQNLKYEGHPGLWHLLLYPLTRISKIPESMQLLHVGIAMANVYMIMRYSPFKRFQKILLSTGYFFIFEYTLISRNYGIGVFLIFCCCTLFQNRKQGTVLFSILIGLMAHTNVLGLISSICFVITILFDRLDRAKSSRILHDQYSHLNDLVSILIASTGIITSIVQLKPPSDSGFASSWNFNFDLEKILELPNQIFHAYLPIPINGLNFWETNLLKENTLLTIAASIFLSVVILLSISYFVHRRTAFVLYISMTMGLLIFFYVKYSGGIRHHGYLYIALLAALWISPSCGQPSSIKTLLENKSYATMDINIVLSRCLTTLFTIQSMGGIIACINDYKYPFSSAKETAEYIKSKNLVNSLIIGHKSPSASAVSGYINRKSIYYLDASRNGTFIRWDDKRKRYNTEHILNYFDNLPINQKRNAVILLNSKLSLTIQREKNIELLFKSQDATVNNEKFYVYRFR